MLNIIFLKLRALQTDHNDLFTRMNVGVQGGWVTVGEASAVGLPTDESQNYYLQPMNVVKENQDATEQDEKLRKLLRRKLLPKLLRVRTILKIVLTVQKL